MDLWIRSQDRTKLVKVDYVSYMDMAEDMNSEKHSIWNDYKGILGIYKSRERALEVLDEIQERLEKVDVADKIRTYVVLGTVKMYDMPEE